MSHGEHRAAGRTPDSLPRPGRERADVPLGTPQSPARLTLTRGAGAGANPGASPEPADLTDVFPGDREAFLEAALGVDDLAAAAFVDALVRRGVSVGTIYMELLAPTADALGRMWDEDSCDFVDVTLATGRLQRAVRELGHGFVGAAPAGQAAGRVLLSALPGEQHTLGLFMVAEFLLRDGWHVRVLTPDTPAELAAAVRDDRYDVVGFSAACDSRLLAMRREIAAVRRHSRNPHVGVVVGGRIFVEHPDLVGRVGADGSAATAADAPYCARSLLVARAG